MLFQKFNRLFSFDISNPKEITDPIRKKPTIQILQ
jgi:hypothetical protein